MSYSYPRPTSIYVASSWRNDLQPGVVADLRFAGFDVYDFKKPKLHNDGFHWAEVMPSARYEGGGVADNSVPAAEYLQALDHPRAVEGFDLDFEAMEACEICVLVLPCGRSAHLELGWFVGRGRRTAVLLDDPCTPELMYRMVDFVALTMTDLLVHLGSAAGAV